MDAFVNRTRRRAAELLLLTYHQQPTTGIDPILELIGFLLEDQAGSPMSPADSSLTAEQWLTWNELVLAQSPEFLDAMNSLLERERIELPTDLESLQLWAIWLVLSTLDQMP